MIEVPLTILRQSLARLNREVQESPGTVIRVAHRGKPSLAVKSAELYDCIVETLDVMSDPDAVESLRGSLVDIGAGRVRGLGDVALRLRLRR